MIVDAPPRWASPAICGLLVAIPLGMIVDSQAAWRWRAPPDRVAIPLGMIVDVDAFMDVARRILLLLSL